MSQLVKGIHHINIQAGHDTLQKTVDFYKDILGLTVYRYWKGRNGNNYMLKTGNDIIEIMENNEKRPSGIIDHFAISTDNVDLLSEKIAEAGYQIVTGPKDVTLKSDPPMPIRIAFYYGPSGEYVELFEEKGE